MTFAPGDRVHIAGIGTGIVREVRNERRYLIEVKGRSMVVAGSQLTPAEQPRRNRRKNVAASRSHPVDEARTTSVPPALDLHGKTVAEAVELLDAFLNEALLSGHATVHVIHGRSGGRVTHAIHSRLAQLSAVRGFRLNPRNPGLTIVTL